LAQTHDHRIVFGPFQPTLEEALANEVRDLHADDPLAPVLLLVGSNLLGRSLTRALARRLGGVGGLRAMTFLDLARALAAPALVRDGLQPIPRGGDRLLARSLAASLTEDPYFSRIARTDGFEEAILATLTDLREGGVTPRDVRAGFPSDSLKTRSLSDLLERFEGRLRAAGIIDRPGLMSRAIAVLAHERDDAVRHAPSLLVDCRRLLIYGFYDLTWQQERLLRHLFDLIAVTIFFPWRNTPAFEFARETRDRLLALVDPKEATSGVALNRPGSLAGINERLFAAPDRAYGGLITDESTPDPALRIIAAPGEPREALEAARAVIDLARSGVPFEEIAVLYRTGDEYPDLIAPLLSRLGVPFFRSDGGRLRQSRSARALLLLLEVRERDFERSLVIDVLTLADQSSDLLAVAGGERETPGTMPNPADWDLLSRLAGITSGRRPWGERLDSLAASLEWRARRAATALDSSESVPPPDPRLIGEARRLARIFARLAKRIDAIPSEGTWREIARAVDRAATFVLAASEERDMLVEILEALGALDVIDQKTTLRDFRRLLDAEIERAGASEGHFQRGHLFLGNVQEARGLSFRAIIIPGLVEHSFPAPSRQDPILLDAERRRLNELAGPDRGRLPLATRRSLEERLLFALAVGSARERLVLTFPRVDPQTARERVPSSFLLRIIEAITGAPCDHQGLQDYPAFERVRIADLGAADRKRAILEREFDLSAVGEAAREGDASGALLMAGVPSVRPFFLRGLRFEQHRFAKSFTQYDGCLRSASTRANLQKSHAMIAGPLSASRLEEYMTCPYKYFCERALGLEPLEAPEDIERLSAIDRGTFVHTVLQEFFSLLRARGDLPLRRDAAPGLKEDLLAMTRRRFSELDARGLTGLPLMRRLDLETIEDDMVLFLAREIDASDEEGPSGLRPAHFEVRFGMPPTERDKDGSHLHDDPLSTDSPVPLELDMAASLLFKGRIDRIDTTADGLSARVIDYKSGRLEEYEDDSLVEGTAVQLPIYILAAEKLLPGVTVSEALYRSVSRRGGFVDIRFGRRNWDHVVAELRAIGGIVRAGVAEGVFFHHPDKDRQCRFCEMKPICGEAREIRFERKRSDRAAAPFLQFKMRVREEG